MNLFLDKNLLFQYAHKAFFRERQPLPSIVIVEAVRKNKINGFVSENTVFSLANHLVYKLTRGDNSIPVEVAEGYSRKYLVKLFKGEWDTTSLDFKDFLEVFNDKRTHLEDVYQWHCFKRSGADNLVTYNINDFSFEKKAIHPVELMKTLKRKRIIGNEFIDDIRKKFSR